MFILSLFSKISFTILIFILIILLLIINHKIVKKSNKKLKIFFSYLITFIIFIISIIGILLIWNVDVFNISKDYLNKIIKYLEVSIGKLISSLLVIFISFIIIRISNLTFKKIGEKKGPLQRRRKTISKLFSSIIKYVVGIIGIIIFLSIWGINVGPALAGLGIIGLVVGLGAQKFITDLITGFFIIFEEHYDVGDVVEIDGFKGNVIDIGLKTTRIQNWRGDIKIISNGNIDSVINYSRNNSVAVVTFTVSYLNDLNSLIKLLNDDLSKLDYKELVSKPEVLGVTNLNKDSIEVQVIAKTLNEQYYGVERNLRLEIKNLLDKNNINFAFKNYVISSDK